MRHTQVISEGVEVRIGIFIERRASAAAEADVQDQPSIEASPADEIILAEMHRQYDLQLHMSEILSTRAGVVLAYLAAVGVMAPGLGSEISMQWRQPGSNVAWVCVLTLLLYGIAIVSCILTLGTRIFRVPVVTELEADEANLAQRRCDLVREIIAEYSRCVLANRSKVQSKNRWLLYAVLFSVAVTFLLVTLSVVLQWN
jgi:hypothetical protein